MDAACRLQHYLASDNKMLHAQGPIDVEAEIREAEECEQRETARAAEEDMARFDALLEERTRRRQVEQGTRWKP